MSSVFISYSRKDERFARQLATALSNRGFDVWIDVEDIPAGMKWSSAIQQGLDTADAMVVVISPDSMASNNVEDEWQYFLDQKKSVFPVLLRSAKIHFQLSRIQYIDFQSQDFTVAFADLESELLKKGITPGGPPSSGGVRGMGDLPPKRGIPWWVWAAAALGLVVVILLAGRGGRGWDRRLRHAHTRAVRHPAAQRHADAHPPAGSQPGPTDRNRSGGDRAGGNGYRADRRGRYDWTNGHAGGRADGHRRCADRYGRHVHGNANAEPPANIGRRPRHANGRRQSDRDRDRSDAQRHADARLRERAPATTGNRSEWRGRSRGRATKGAVGAEPGRQRPRLTAGWNIVCRS